MVLLSAIWFRDRRQQKTAATESFRLVRHGRGKCLIGRKSIGARRPRAQIPPARPHQSYRNEKGARIGNFSRIEQNCSKPCKKASGILVSEGELGRVFDSNVLGSGKQLPCQSGTPRVRRSVDRNDRERCCQIAVERPSRNFQHR